MKVRDYMCTNCGHTFEEFVLHDSDDVHCPKCNSTKVTANVSAASFKVTGQGAYTNKMRV